MNLIHTYDSQFFVLMSAIFFNSKPTKICESIYIYLTSEPYLR